MTKIPTPLTRTAMVRLHRRGLVQAGAAGMTAAALARTGLGGAQEATPAASPDVPVIPEYDGSEVTITYGIWDSAQEAGINEQIAAFNEEFPNITVELQLTPWGDYWTKLQTAVAGGEAFDVFWLNSANLPVYASAGALLPLDSALQDGSLDKDNYPSQIVEMYAYEGLQYGLPRDYDTIGLFYNKDIFDEAGMDYPDETWTWDDLRSAAEQLTDEGAGRWGIGLQNSWQENWYNFVYSNEGDLLNEDRTAAVVADDPNSAEALKVVVQYFLDGLTPGMDIQQANPVAESLFPAGQVAMMPGGSFRAKTYSEADANIDVAPLPVGKVSSGVIHGLANVVWSGSQNQAAAAQFVKWLAGETAATILGETGMGLPAYAGLESTWLDAVSDMNAQVFIDAAETARPVPDPEVGFEWQVEIMNVMVAGFTGEIPVDDVPQAAQDAANEVL